MLHCFVGWDAREVEAYEICRHSLIRRSSEPVKVYPVMEQPLRHAGLYTRKFTRDETGQRIDSIDGKPFSTDFSFTRFLVPEMARRMNLTGHVLFCDSDMLWLRDVVSLFEGAASCETEDFAVHVVKHNYVPKSAVKMDGMKQDQYSRKLWSSLMVFNMDHPAVEGLTPEVVNEASGAYLHGFEWCGSNEIGEVSETWNWIPHSSPTTQGSWPQDCSRVIHFTEGIPGMKYRKPTEFDYAWQKEKRHLDASKENSLGEPI